MTETNVEGRILDAALLHVPFDGWGGGTLARAAKDAQVPLSEARALFPRGGVDLALAYHRRGDDLMAQRIARESLDGMRFRDRVACAVRWRIEAISDKEAVRRGATLFALPMYSSDGARALWGTADRIWTALGDSSNDLNWYTKRASLAGVYGSTVLYWLGDDSLDGQATWSFLDRRIDDVMQIEKAKAAVNANPLMRAMMAGPNWVAGRVRRPRRGGRTDLPGSLSGRR